MNKPLNITDFKKVEITDDLHYLSLNTGDYEITIEPHLTAGYTVGVYAHSDPLLSIKKRAVWKFNHPTYEVKNGVAAELIDRALAIAEYYYEYYQLKNREAVAPFKN